MQKDGDVDEHSIILKTAFNIIVQQIILLAIRKKQTYW